ncbi:hypothetical protein C8R42DRAFT_655565 [Lentinula raphanica]|nr:hypothetical protein C8R42DRAFT_655565 [Lentinula raphanica]
MISWTPSPYISLTLLRLMAFQLQAELPHAQSVPNRSMLLLAHAIIVIMMNINNPLVSLCIVCTVNLCVPATPNLLLSPSPDCYLYRLNHRGTQKIPLSQCQL